MISGEDKIMALSLKDNNETKKDSTTRIDDGNADNRIDDFSDLEASSYKPVVISTDVPNVDDLVSKKDKNITGTIIKAVVAVIIAIIAFTAVKKIIKNVSGKDITDYVNKSEEEIEKALDIKLTDAPEKVSSVHQYSNGNISVSSDGDVSVI